MAQDIIRKYRVTAQHHDPSYSIKDRVFTCHPNADGTWYATAPKLGCGKDRPDCLSAINYILDNEAFAHAGRSIVAEVSHTPGPWVIAGNDIRRWDGEQTHERVASAAPPGELPDWTDRDDWTSATAATSANARLISAAPELLSLANLVIGLPDALVAMERAQPGSVRALREAIAKTEGA